MTTDILELKTNSELLETLKKATTKGMTTEDLKEQRASFVYGSLSSNSSVTKAEIKKFLEKHDLM